MELDNLNQDRFLRKDPNQDDQTKGAVYAALNPSPKRGDDSLRKIGRPKGSEEDDGAPNILTGTVITSCFIQTSALPSRIELQGNDLTFFDDTYEDNGVVIGDTSRLIFTHGSGKDGEMIIQGFVLEKRASTHDTYDNVLSLYSLPPKQGRMNYMFFGGEGRGLYQQTNQIQFNVNHSSGPVTQDAANGAFNVTGSFDGTNETPIFSIAHNSVFGAPGEAYSVSFNTAGAASQFGVNLNGVPAIYASPDGVGGVEIDVGGSIIPIVNNSYNIGSPTNGFSTIYTDKMFVGLLGDAGHKVGMYGTVTACPLPTVPNALEILDRIAEPAEVGERGDFGPGIYFDDIGFPEELLYEMNGKQEIEHTKMIGFLMKVVKEQNEKMKLMEERIKTLEEK